MTNVLDKTDLAPADLITGWHHLEFWVGNARQAAHFLATAFGFEIIGYAGPETGVIDRASYALAQGDIRFVVTAGLTADSEVTGHVRAHGDGVRDIALSVKEAHSAFDAAVARGAQAKGDDVIATYGDTRHSFIDKAGFEGFVTDDLPVVVDGPRVGLRKIDHVVGNVAKGDLDQWVDFYRSVMGFDQLVHFDDDQISTEYSALMSTVVWDGSKVVLPINEPADGLRKSQIQEYLDYYGSPGVQHIALRTDDIIATVTALRARGVRFLRIPETYYDDVRLRLSDLDLPWEELQRLGVLIDRDHDGHLLQIFTENIGDRPTVFFEIIQREGAKGFGAGNFKALFEAIEREQARRGNL
jgi:4-hydroxyphenylpyruvate dioxygenase